MLTVRQKQILDFIEQTCTKKGIAPTHTEIAKHFRLSSVSTVNEHLSALKEKGFLERIRWQARAMTPVGHLQLGDVAVPIRANLGVTVTDNLLDIFTTKKYKLDHIFNVDCLDMFSHLKDDSLDLIFADPPYNLSKSNFKMKFVRSGGSDLSTNKGKWDNYSEQEFETFTARWLAESYRTLKHGGSIWVAGSYHSIYLVGYLMKKIGFEILNEVLWHKSDATPNLSCTRFVADHENFIWARKGKRHIFNYEEMKLENGGKQMRSIWTRGKTAGGKRIHPTQKPEWLLDRVIRASTNPEHIVFDPFMGSGTTAVVAKRNKRHYVGSEIDPEYFEKALTRLAAVSV